jgi:predicted AAA+ superfamily ATPase
MASDHDPSSVRALLRLVAARSASLAVFDALGREVGLDGKTLKTHLDLLERLYLMRIRRAWHVNLGQRQVKAPKLYLSDTGLLAGLIGIDARRAVTDGGVAGTLFETFVATELERQGSWALPMTFWHSREDRREVDIVVERPSGEIVGVEVKAAATVRRGDLAGLAHLRDRLGARFRSGVVVYLGERTLRFGDRLWAVPLEALWSS